MEMTQHVIQLKLQRGVSVRLTTEYMHITWDVSNRLYYLWQQWQIKHMNNTWQWITKTMVCEQSSGFSEDLIAG